MKCDKCFTGDAIAAGGDTINCLNCGYVGPAYQRPAVEQKADDEADKKPRLRRGK